MYVTKFIVFQIMLLQLINVNAQTKKIKPLNPGDTLPYLRFEVHTGNMVDSINLSDYKGKLLLLDFWGTWCASCIASMPHMLELQRQFPDKLKIVMVTDNTAQELKDFWKKNREKKPVWLDAGLQLPFITGDSVLSALFPHFSAPAHVWIDQNRVFKTLARDETTTSETVADFLNGKKVELNTMVNLPLMHDKPLEWFVYPAVRAEGLVNNYHFISGFIDCSRDFGVYINDSISGKVIGVSCLNKDLMDLYKMAYSDWAKNLSVYQFENRIDVSTRFKKNFFGGWIDRAIFKDGLAWMKANQHTYVSREQTDRPSTVFRQMKIHLNDYFQLKTRIVKKSRRCMVLSSITPALKIKTKGGEAKSEIVSDTTILINQSVAALADQIGGFVEGYRKMPFFNEVFYKGNIDIKFPSSDKYSDEYMSKLINTLKSYGLALKIENRVIDILEIRDK